MLVRSVLLIITPSNIKQILLFIPFSLHSFFVFLKVVITAVVWFGSHVAVDDDDVFFS